MGKQSTLKDVLMESDKLNLIYFKISKLQKFLKFKSIAILILILYEYIYYLYQYYNSKNLEKNHSNFFILWDIFLVFTIFLFKISKNYFFHRIDSSNSWKVIEYKFLLGLNPLKSSSDEDYLLALLLKVCIYG